MPSFKASNAPAQRELIALDGIRQGKVPIVCERHSDCSLVDIEKKKFLVANDMLAREFATALRRHLEAHLQTKIDLLVEGGALFPSTENTLMQQIHALLRDKDGLLYVFYTDASIKVPEHTHDEFHTPEAKSSHALCGDEETSSGENCNGEEHMTARQGRMSKGTEMEDVEKAPISDADTPLEAPRTINILCVKVEGALAPELRYHEFTALADSALAELTKAIKQQVIYSEDTTRDALQHSLVLIIDNILLPATSHTVTVGDVWMRFSGGASNKRDESGALLVISYAYSDVEEESDSTKLLSSFAATERAKCAGKGSYKNSHSFADRFRESSVAIKQGKVPIVCEVAAGSIAPNLNNRKFLIDPTASVRALVILLRQCIRETATGAINGRRLPFTRIYLLVAGGMLTTDTISIGDLHRYYKDEDDFLYVTYSYERPGPEVRHIGEYRSSHSFKERLRDANKALQTGRIPIVCERKENSNVPRAKQRKFFVMGDMSVGTFYILLRERVMAEVGQPVYLFIDGTPVAVDLVLMSELYAKYKDEDKMLYVSYAGEPSYY